MIMIFGSFSLLSTHNQIKCFFYRPIGQNENDFDRKRPKLQLQTKMKRKRLIKFFVRLCGDVIVDVFHYANRRQLTKLARVGRRFHLIIENFFGETPIFRLKSRKSILFRYIFLRENIQNLIFSNRDNLETRQTERTKKQ